MEENRKGSGYLAGNIIDKYIFINKMYKSNVIGTKEYKGNSGKGVQKTTKTNIYNAVQAGCHPLLLLLSEIQG